MEYRYSKSVHDHFIFEEGMRNKSYKDTRGYWTIGIGHLLGAHDDFSGMYWTDPKILMTFENDLDRSFATAKEVFPEYSTFPHTVQIAILDMIFNLGASGFRQFKQTIRLIHNGEYSKAADSAALSLWARQVPNRARRTCDLLRTV